MSVLKRKLMISCASIAMMVFLCYGAYPRNTVPASDDVSRPLTVILDAGHGGEDGGAQSADKVKESDINLQIALKADDLSALVGVCSVLTRASDVSLHDTACTSIAEKKASDLRNRVKLVDATEYAILVSIHQNHFPQEKYSGAQVFYSADGRSKSLAENIQQDMKLLDKQNKRQAKPCKGIYLMDHATCPAVLVECGFLSNTQEVQKLQDETYQKKLAMTILRTISQKGNGVLEHEI